LYENFLPESGISYEIKSLNLNPNQDFLVESQSLDLLSSIFFSNQKISSNQNRVFEFLSKIGDQKDL